MDVPLLATKLHLPRAHQNLVPRPRLAERLDAGLNYPLTLISAPAGSGKTSVLSAWIPHSERCITWLSLDEGDNDPTRFWLYVIAALQRLRPDLGKQAHALLQAQGPQPQPIESVLTVLLNEIAAFLENSSTHSTSSGGAAEQAPLQAGFALVLDDYHVIDAPAIHAGITFLLDHLPSQMHLIIASRTDPPLPLARLRAGNLLAELRLEDLRFTSEEVDLFLNRVMGLQLAVDDVAALATRIEGWVVGLQLAALSLQGRDEEAKRRFVSSFTGSQRYILDYLVEEVLQRQPEGTQEFLLQTSILTRLTGPLCDAVTGRVDGQALLEELERANLFLIPLDEERGWYRYHQLFAEVLRLRLQQTHPDLVAELHRKAATWCASHGLIDNAVRHALAAGDAAWTARLIEQHVEEILRRGEGETLRRWVAVVPQEVVRDRPRLILAQAIAAFNAGRLEAAEPLLDDAERALTTPSEPYEPSIGRQASMLANLPVAIALLRAALVGLRGDAERTTELVRWTLTQLTEDEQVPRFSGRWNLALADWMCGRLAEAERAFTDIVAAGRAAGEPHLTLSAGSALGRVQRAQGRLGAALHTYQEGIEFAARIGSAAVPTTAMAHVGMAEVFYQRNQLEQALHHATAGIPLGRQLISTLSPAIGLATLAWIRQAFGDPAGAQEAIDEAYQVMPAQGIAALHNPVPAERARLLLAQGNVRGAVDWADARGLGEADEPSYPREREYLVLARVLLAKNVPDRALGLLERLGAAAEAQARIESVIEVRLLAALALDALGEHARAQAALVEALALARPEGYVRVFVDEGAPMAALMRQVTGEQRSYAEQLLAAYPEGLEARDLRLADAVPASSLKPQASTLVEPLSERELEVLRVLATGLSNRAIAQKLYLSVATVKVHLKHIYGKLAVNSRMQAVARARELNLL
jgi:LuxR family maltose regulon positive regulatory protein